MKLYSTLFVCFFSSLFFSSYAVAENDISTSDINQAIPEIEKTPAINIAAGKKIYDRNCSTCHGHHGQRPAFGRSAIINQLNTEELVEALKLRKAGKIRGPGNRAKARLSEQQMKEVAEYIQTLKK